MVPDVVIITVEVYMEIIYGLRIGAITDNLDP